MKLDWRIAGFGVVFCVWVFDPAMGTQIVFTAIHVRHNVPYRGISVKWDKYLENLFWDIWTSGKHRKFMLRGPLVVVK